jgi:hypothetical protein
MTPPVNGLWFDDTPVRGPGSAELRQSAGAFAPVSWPEAQYFFAPAVIASRMRW